VQDNVIVHLNAVYPGAGRTTPQLTVHAPVDGFYGLRVGCSVNGVETDALFYGSGGDLAHGPGVGGSGPGVSHPPGGATDPGSDGAAACFAGFVKYVSFVGVSVPWPDLFALPGDMLCFAQRLVVGTGSDWSNQLSTMSDDFRSSSLGFITTLASIPFNAWSSFTSTYSGGSCTGPTINLGYSDSTSHDANVTPFAACSGNIVTVAAVVRGGQVGLAWIAFAFFAFRVLSSAVGWEAGVTASEGG
jgi:hypothetical protein